MRVEFGYDSVYEHQYKHDLQGVSEWQVNKCEYDCEYQCILVWVKAWVWVRVCAIVLFWVWLLSPREYIIVNMIMSAYEYECECELEYKPDWECRVRLINFEQNFKPECIVWLSTIWWTCKIHIYVE